MVETQRHLGGAACVPLVDSQQTRVLEIGERKGEPASEPAKLRQIGAVQMPPVPERNPFDPRNSTHVRSRMW